MIGRKFWCNYQIILSWILLKVTCNYWWLLIWEEPWYEVGEYVSGRPPAQLHHKPGQTVLRHKRLSQIWDLWKKLWDLVFKEVRGILRFPNSIPPSHYKRLNCTWSTISTWEVMGRGQKFKTHLLRKVVDIDVIVKVGVLEGRAHLRGGQLFKLGSVGTAKKEDQCSNLAASSVSACPLTAKPARPKSKI